MPDVKSRIFSHHRGCAQTGLYVGKDAKSEVVNPRGSNSGNPLMTRTVKESTVKMDDVEVSSGPTINMKMGGTKPSYASILIGYPVKYKILILKLVGTIRVRV